jgi:transposase
MPTAPLQHVATPGIDVGGTTFHLIGLDVRGAIVLRQKLSRGQVEQRMASRPSCLIGLEACVGAIGGVFRLSESAEPWSRLIKPNLRL